MLKKKIIFFGNDIIEIKYPIINSNNFQNYETSENLKIPYTENMLHKYELHNIIQ